MRARADKRILFRSLSRDARASRRAPLGSGALSEIERWVIWLMRLFAKRRNSSITARCRARLRRQEQIMPARAFFSPCSPARARTDQVFLFPSSIWRASGDQVLLRLSDWRTGWLIGDLCACVCKGVLCIAGEMGFRLFDGARQVYMRGPWL